MVASLCHLGGCFRRHQRLPDVAVIGATEFSQTDRSQRSRLNVTQWGCVNPSENQQTAEDVNVAFREEKLGVREMPRGEPRSATASESVLLTSGWATGNYKTS